MIFLGVRDTEPETARYEGMIACTLLIDRTASIGWRDLTQEAMAMRRVLDGTVNLDSLTASERPPCSARSKNRSAARSGGTPTTARKAAVRGTTEEASA